MVYFSTNSRTYDSISCHSRVITEFAVFEFRFQLQMANCAGDQKEKVVRQMTKYSAALFDLDEYAECNNKSMDVSKYLADGSKAYSHCFL